MDEWDWGHKVVLPSALGGGVVFSLLTWLFICPWLRQRVTREHEEAVNEQEATSQLEAESGDRASTLNSSQMVEHEVDSDAEYDVDTGEVTRNSITKPTQVIKEIDVVAKPENVLMEQPKYQNESSPLMKLWNYFADNTFRQDLHVISLGESHRAAAIWEKASEYDPKSERLFQYLQVFTACLASFAHGSNDVANAIAPVSGILQIYKDGEFVSKADVNRGILAMGGIAIGLGFTFFGYRIIKAVGFKLTAISPSRGFCIELGAALAVSLASFVQIPVSTTQCLVGATCGVGLAAGGPKNVEWMFLLRTLCGWIGIFFVVALVEAGVFSFCVFSPTL